MLLLPVVIILLAAGASGLIYARKVMLNQWDESVMLQLERAAHDIDMQLSRPMELMEMFGAYM